MKKKQLLYEIVMGILALAVVAILLFESIMEVNPAMQRLFTITDLTILAIFAVDYIVRFIIAPKKWPFFKSNIFDLVAIIPFDKAFRIARLARLTRLARLSRVSKVTRLARVTLFLRRIGNTVTGVLKTNGLHYVLILTTVLIVGGGFGIYLLEPDMNSIGDALWWSLVTTTTVGYGDISPASIGGRLLAAFLMIIGISLLGMVTGSIATYFVDKLNRSSQKKTFTDYTKAYIQEQIENIPNLSRQEVEMLCNTIRQLHQSQEEAAASKD